MDNSKQEDYIEFLLNQNDLKGLVLKGWVQDKFSFDRRLLDVKFRLEKLNIHNWSMPLSFCPMEFVKLHKETLQEIAINTASKDYLKTVKDFPNLKKVALTGFNDTDGISMPQVEELVKCNCNEVIHFSFPNVKKLKIAKCNRSTPRVLNFDKLEELEITNEDRDDTFSDTFSTFRMPLTIKKFKISRISPAYYIPFNMLLHNVEEIEIDSVKDESWIANFLRYVENRKVNVTFKNLCIGVVTSKALKVFKDKIEKLTIINCTPQWNPLNIKYKFDGISNESDDEEETEESAKRTFKVDLPYSGDYGEEDEIIEDNMGCYDW